MSLRPYLLAAVALVLAGLVARDYWPAGQDMPLTSPQATTPAAIPALNPLSRRGDGDFAALFDYPLFAPTRSKPVAEAPPADATPALVVATDSPPVPAPEPPSGPAQPVLMGTVTSPWPGGAYLGDDAGGAVVFLRPGQAWLGLHLEEVQSDSAIFMGPEGEVTLALRKSPAADVGAPAGDAAQSDAPATMRVTP